MLSSIRSAVPPVKAIPSERVGPANNQNSPPTEAFRKDLRFQRQRFTKFPIWFLLISCGFGVDRSRGIISRGYAGVKEVGHAAALPPSLLGPASWRPIQNTRRSGPIWNCVKRLMGKNILYNGEGEGKNSCRNSCQGRHSMPFTSYGRSAVVTQIPFAPLYSPKKL